MFVCEYCEVTKPISELAGTGANLATYAMFSWCNDCEVGINQLKREYR